MRELVSLGKGRTAENAVEHDAQAAEIATSYGPEVVRDMDRLYQMQFGATETKLAKAQHTADLVLLMTNHNWAHLTEHSMALRTRGEKQARDIRKAARKLPTAVVRDIWEKHARRNTSGHFWWGPALGSG